MRTGFNKSAVARAFARAIGRARAAGFNASKEAGVFIAPHNYAAAVAFLGCVGRNARVCSNDRSIGLRSIGRVAS